MISFVGCGGQWSVIMPLVHVDPQPLRTGLVSAPRMFSALGSRALILGTLLFATLNSSWAQDPGWSRRAKLIRSTRKRRRSRFNGIMPAPRTDPAHLFVVEQEEAADQTT